MLVDITNKRFCIFGLQGSGKSVLVKHILRAVPNHMVYDVLHEHKGFNRYLPNHRQFSREALAELDSFVNRIVIGSGLVRLFVLEEANRFCRPKPYPLPASILDLNDFQRHQRIAFGVVARRPTQLHSDLVELAHYLFIFRLVGKNDHQYLEAIAEGLGDTVRSLDKYHFVIVDQDRSYHVQEPIAYEEPK